MSEVMDDAALDPEDAAVLAELRAEFASRLRDDLEEVDQELANIRAGAGRAGYQRIEELMHRDAGAGAVFGFEEAGELARRVEELVQSLGQDLSDQAQRRIAEAIVPLRRIAASATG